MVPFILIGATCSNADDTAAEAIERMKVCLEGICDNDLKMLKEKNIPRAWVERAKASLKTIDSMYVIYLESFISRVDLANRNANFKRPTTSSAKISSPKKRKPATVSGSLGMSTNNNPHMSRASLANASSPKAKSPRLDPIPLPTRRSVLATQTTMTPAPSTPSIGQIGRQTTIPSFTPNHHRLDEGLFRALTKAEQQHTMKQERVKLRHQGSRDAAATVKPSEIAPGIVSRRQLTYGSPVRKAGGVNGKPAWR